MFDVTDELFFCPNEASSLLLTAYLFAPGDK
jgi:hypothetical protein